ncbi:hypothetical protein JCM11491_001550 [Sporobolomyces phaffii]
MANSYSLPRRVSNFFRRKSASSSSQDSEVEVPASTTVPVCETLAALDLLSSRMVAPASPPTTPLATVEEASSAEPVLHIRVAAPPSPLIPLALPYLSGPLDSYFTVSPASPRADDDSASYRFPPPSTLASLPRPVRSAPPSSAPPREASTSSGSRSSVASSVPADPERLGSAWSDGSSLVRASTVDIPSAGESTPTGKCGRTTARAGTSTSRPTGTTDSLSLSSQSFERVWPGSARIRRVASTSRVPTVGESIERIDCGSDRRRPASVPVLANGRPVTREDVESLVAEFGHSDSLATFIVDTLGIRGSNDIARVQQLGDGRDVDDDDDDAGWDGLSAERGPLGSHAFFGPGSALDSA